MTSPVHFRPHAGIGARKTPRDVSVVMRRAAWVLAQQCYRIAAGLDRKDNLIVS